MRLTSQNDCKIDFNPLRICTGLVLMYLQLILTPYTNEWV